MSSNLAAIAALVLAIGLFYWFTMAGKTSGSEARRLVAEGAKLVDVRTPAEFTAGHVSGAINVPLQELESRLGELGKPDDVFVLYCRSGARSGQAKRLLEGKGFNSVHDVGAMSRYGE